MKPNIQFTFEGKCYTAPASFYDTNLAKLPDGRIVRALGWQELRPPSPKNIVVAEIPKGSDETDAQYATRIKAAPAAFEPRTIDDLPQDDGCPPSDPLGDLT